MAADAISLIKAPKILLHGEPAHQLVSSTVLHPAGLLPLVTWFAIDLCCCTAGTGTRSISKAPNDPLLMEVVQTTMLSRHC